MKKLLALILALGLMVSLALPALALGEPVTVATEPQDASYQLNAAAAPLTAVFDFDYETGVYVGEIRIYWYVSPTREDHPDDSAVTPRESGYINNYQQIETSFVPPTDTAGVFYYYASVSYEASYYNEETGDYSDPVWLFANTKHARIEVARSAQQMEFSFTVRKTDDNGNPLSGAVIALTPYENYQQSGTEESYEETTKNGSAVFTVAPGNYVLSEKYAPEGYNATDEKFYIMVSENGIFIDYHTQSIKPYETVTFVNKKIPTLNKEDHFAFMKGYPDGSFGPERNMTRAEAVVMFARLLSESMDMDKSYKNSFYPDVNADAWYANEVGYMQSLGVLADYSRDQYFRPNDYVTRAEFATLAAHFDNLTLTDTNKFSDVANDYWAVRYINSAAAKGWIIGYSDGTFKPEANITRAEVVTLVGRILDRSADSAYLKANASALPRVYADVPVTHWAYLAVMEASVGHDYIRDETGEHWTAVYE